MKARLLGLLFLCCGLLFALSLMVVDESSASAPPPEPLHPYIQAMALPVPAPTVADNQDAVKAMPLDSEIELHGLHTRSRSCTGSAPEQTLPYYEQAYYAFHFSDEAG